MNNFNIISFLGNYKKGESGSYPPILPLFPPIPIIPPVEDNRFYIEDVSGMINQVKMVSGGSGVIPNPSIEYSYDGNIWQEWVDYRNNSIVIQPNSKVYLRGGNDSFNSFNKECSYNAFSVMHAYVVGGDVTCLLRPEGNVYDLSNKSGCFNHLFYAQSNLKSVVKLRLPSTKLGFNTYDGMFEGCSAIYSAPYLPATKLATRCYEFLFKDCRKLSYISVGATTWDSSDAYNWVLNVASEGQFDKPSSLSIPNGVSGIPSKWNLSIQKSDSFYIEDCSGVDNVFRVRKENMYSPDIQLEYSYDNIRWKNWGSLYTTQITIKANNRLYLRGTNNIVNSNIFNAEGRFNVGGDLSCLLEPNGNIKDLTGRDYAFSSIFRKTNVVNAKDLKLPSDILSLNAYAYMFEECPMLKTPPELPAKILGSHCYGNMFKNCVMLESAPMLLAEKVNSTDYQFMFADCPKINTIVIRAKKWGNQGSDWLRGVSEFGIFCKPKELKVGSGINEISPNNIPSKWKIIDI